MPCFTNVWHTLPAGAVANQTANPDFPQDLHVFAFVTQRAVCIILACGVCTLHTIYTRYAVALLSSRVIPQDMRALKLCAVAQEEACSAAAALRIALRGPGSRRSRLQSSIVSWRQAGCAAWPPQRWATTL